MRAVWMSRSHLKAKIPVSGYKFHRIFENCTAALSYTYVV